MKQNIYYNMWDILNRNSIAIIVKASENYFITNQDWKCLQEFVSNCKTKIFNKIAYSLTFFWKSSNLETLSSPKECDKIKYCILKVYWLIRY